MSASASEGVTEGRQDDDDVLGFPGDGFVDNTDTNPVVFGEQDEEGDDSRMDEAGAASFQGSGKKRKKSAVLAPDTGFEEGGQRMDEDVEGKIGPANS